MKSVTIRDLPDETVNKLAARARADGRSMQEYLRRHLVEYAASPTIAEWLEATEGSMRPFRTHVSTDAILAAKHEDHP